MSAQTVFFASLTGGVLERRLMTRSTDKAQFTVRSAGSSFEQLTVFLSPSEAAQWARVLAEYADGAA